MDPAHRPPAKGHFVSVNGYRIHYEDVGEGTLPPILLIHGYLESLACWSKMIQPLSQNHRVIAMDLPGYGYSDRPDNGSYTFDWMADQVLAFLDALKLKKVKLVGHSMGAGIGILLAGKFSDRIERFVNIDGVCYPIPLPFLGRLALTPVIGPILFKKGYRKNELRSVMEKDIYYQQSVLTDEKIDLLWAHFCTPGGKDAAYRSLQALSQRANLVPWISRIPVPTLIIWGEKERVHPVKHAHLLKQDIAGAQLEIIKDSGHVPMEEQPEAVLNVLLPFFS